jgi:hypothetical protein
VRLASIYLQLAIVNIEGPENEYSGRHVGSDCSEMDSTVRRISARKNASDGCGRLRWKGGESIFIVVKRDSLERENRVRPCSF